MRRLSHGAYLMIAFAIFFLACLALVFLFLGFGRFAPA